MVRASSLSDIQKTGGLKEDFQNSAKGTSKDRLKGPSFEETLRSLDVSQPSVSAKAALPTEGLQFSNHAVERMRSRGITYNSSQMERLSSAVQKAASKGARDALVIVDDSAMIVSVKNNKIVTVIDKNMLKENVFTNIDSTVFA
jgi:flagellar operon protein